VHTWKSKSGMKSYGRLLHFFTKIKQKSEKNLAKIVLLGVIEPTRTMQIGTQEKIFKNSLLTKKLWHAKNLNVKNRT
jgi:hypothetical protein